MSSKEANIDFGDNELNKLYEKLDPETKAQVTRISTKGEDQEELQIKRLKKIQNELQRMKTKMSLTKTIKEPTIISKKYTSGPDLPPDLLEVFDGLSKEQQDDFDILDYEEKLDLLKGIQEEQKEQGKKGIQQNQDKLEEIEITELEEVDEDLEEEPVEVKKTQPQLRFDNLVKTYYDNNHNGELEVKFGTKGIKSITKNNYDNVVRKLKSSGFSSLGEENGEYYLRINCEFLDSITGRFKMSNIRTDIRSLQNIQEYCKTNDIKNLPQKVFVEHMTKGPMFINREKINPVDFDDFNFRVTYSAETPIQKIGIINNLTENWRKSKKEFRLINRVTFVHDDYPFKVDLSIVKYANRLPDKFGRENRGPVIRVYTLEESNVLNNTEIYEIEIELDNRKVGPGTRFNNPQLIVDALRKVIKNVLSGMQSSNYPISYPEQKYVLESYMKLIMKDKYDPKKYVSSRYFIGPNSYTLQIENVAAIDENSNRPNIRKDFIVTDKADGERHLLYISKEGKIYLINTNMDVIFTGARTDNEDCCNTLLDGELITHDKNGKFINLYAAFDIYYIKNQDVRANTFLTNFEKEKEKDKKEREREREREKEKPRYNLLHFIRQNLNPVAITMTNKNTNKKTNVPEIKTKDSLLSPLRFSVKEFFPTNSKQTIFEGCQQILQKETEGRFEYNTDGLIFTHSFYGVGSTSVGQSGPTEKITWEYSFKWKPPQYNTIDFLVTTEKGPNGDDIVKTVFEDGLNNTEVLQLNEYKKIVLRCGFKEKSDGFINPCQDIIDDNLPQYQVRYEDRQDNDYIPQRFYPTDPYDVNAGLTNIMLRADSSGSKKMFSEENQVFEDNTIVEFRYDFTQKEGWKWIPLRVRYDKTARLRKGEKEYGNAYHVCNSNWKSIHPTGRITADMLATGLNIPDISVSEDKYYNTPAGKFKTESMKQFHNLYVKKHLIAGVAKQGDTLIDMACGKAGDLPKWISAKLSFVFGVDISKDNLENRMDGACARFLKARKMNKSVPYALFVNGNSAFNIKDGSAMLNEKAKQITAAVFGHGSKESSKIGAGVARQYGKGIDGFHVSSCQFAVHYFFENPDTLRGFVKNLAECTKHNGYFIGTAYDGKLVFNELKKVKTGESIKIIEDEKKIWEVTKRYGSDNFEDDSSSIGYRIDVFQESINQSIPEYLVNFDYFNRIMTAYGFEVLTREEANEFGLPEGTGLFNELFLYMLDEIAKNKYKAKDYGNAPMMSSIEKKISFLNRYFVYKKVRVVNTEAIELELGEYNETAALRDKNDTEHAVQVAEEVEQTMSKPKIRKLSKKLLLVAATEAIDEEPIVVKSSKTASKKDKVKKDKDTEIKKSKKIIIIDSDEED
jgi:hypothetical protein